MADLQLIAVLISLAALFGYVNRQFLHLPMIIGILFISLVAALIVTFIDASGGFGLRVQLAGFVERIDLSKLLLHEMLAFLLFAGAMQVNLDHLLTRKWSILALATVGVAFSTLLFGAAFYGMFRLVGPGIPLIWCLLLGAVVSPTDPVAILSTLRRYGVPPGLRATIEGESMFNDGVAIVLFTLLLDLAMRHAPEVEVLSFVEDFAIEFFGAILLGLSTGGFVLLLMRTVDDYVLELLLSLALVSGSYSIAQTVHVSGPISVVVAGLMVGNHAARLAMSDQTRERIRLFWEMVDDVLNAVLFLLIGIEVIAIHLDPRSLLAAALAIPIVIVVRAISVSIGALPLSLDSKDKWRGLALLVWAGLRGGISVALALSIPEQAFRTPLITVCYGIVLFTMLVQAPTLPWLVSRIFPDRVRHGE